MSTYNGPVAEALGWRSKMPHLDNWEIVYFPGDIQPSLSGVVTGHPKIANGHRIVTSTLRELDGITMTARTANTTYTLGTPNPDTPMGRKLVELETYFSPALLDTPAEIFN